MLDWSMLRQWAVFLMLSAWNWVDELDIGRQLF